jgi:hypothetical protein
MKNFVGVRPFRNDIKPYFRFYSAPLGEVVEATVQFRNNGRAAAGFYLCLTDKTLLPDGAVQWLPMSARQTNLLLHAAPRFSLPKLQQFAGLLDLDIPGIVALWRDGGPDGIEGFVAAVLNTEARRVAGV